MFACLMDASSVEKPATSIPALRRNASYVKRMSKPLSIVVNMEHTFLQLPEECHYERLSFFQNEDNRIVLRNLSKQFQLHEYVDNPTDIIIISFREEYCCIYCQHRCIGMYHMGFTSMLVDPSLANAFLRNIVDEMLEHDIDFPILITNESSKYFAKSFNLLEESFESLQKYLQDSAPFTPYRHSDCPDRIPTSWVTNSLLVIFKIWMEQAKQYQSPIIMHAKPLGLTFDCLPLKILSLYNSNIKIKYLNLYAVYLCDDTVNIYYHRLGSGECVLVAKYTSMCRRPEDDASNHLSLQLQHTLNFIKTQVILHAIAQGVNDIHCRVYETGLARRLSVLGSLVPQDIMLTPG